MVPMLLWYLYAEGQESRSDTRVAFDVGAAPDDEPLRVRYNPHEDDDGIP